MSNYAKIKLYDIANGEGIGVSIFLSGCDANPKCKGCFNSNIWNPNIGKEFTNDTINKILDIMNNEHISHLSILGGDPMADYNVKSTLQLVKFVKEKFPNKKIWLWTWRLYENLLTSIRGIGTIIDGELHPYPQNCRNDILNYIDILVDGRFIEEEKDLTLKWSGSSSQRVIDVQNSLKYNKVILYEKKYYNKYYM